MRCGLVGVFWGIVVDGLIKSERLKPFTGTIEIGEDAHFQGETEDCFRRAIIDGQFVGRVMHLKKKYIRDWSGCEPETFLYELQSMGPPETEGHQIICGGYKGIALRLSDEEIFGVVCVVFPAP